MEKKIKILSEFILNLPRFTKITIAILTDITLCIISFWLAFYLRIDEFVSLRGNILIAAIISIFITIIVFWLFSLYRTMFRYSGRYVLSSIAFAVGVYGLIYFSIIAIYVIPGVPRSIGIIQPLILFFAVSASRLLVRFFFNPKANSKKNSSLKNAIVYGAGNAGRQLVLSLENSFQIKVRGFLDDDASLHGQVINGKEVSSVENLSKIIKSKKIELILLAIPSVGRIKRMKIIEKLTQHKVTIRTLPSINDLIEGKISVSDIRDLDISDILVRDSNFADEILLKKNINNKVIMITGAGGSIGSELSRQILNLIPNKIILLELSEFNLYKINQELIELKKKQNIFSKIQIIPLIASVTDKEKISKIINSYKPDTIYHAAAYKHVSMVEENICEGVKNNIFGTIVTLDSAIKENVSNFVLVSSDKAVRPTNIMGATKRIAELYLIAISKEIKNSDMKFCAVRFGNVLGSSGSIIPKFKKQIYEGGPITLTHPEVTRYFMTIPEAVQLVINAGLLSNGGDIFLLDMGKPIKIKDLIYRIVKLSGLEVRDEKNPDGDIAIDIIGLRPGEKLYEELLVGDDQEKTQNPKIFKANDPYISFTELNKNLKQLEYLINSEQIPQILKLFEDLVVGFKKDREISDHIYLNQINTEIKNSNGTK